ncbi:MAG: limonene-1,2-epoxide hydrolase family protein [Novosphingobium sp.]|nr:limonene-1,2-epoxide hydrolase family protein [Novosphingobium sp.]
MATPTQTVIAFLDAWGAGPGGIAKAFGDYFTPETVWENIGMSKTTGPDEAMAVLAGFGESADKVSMSVDNLAVAAIGGRVLTERVDHILDASGKPTMSIQVMGIFETQDGKITAWRDYFDTAGFGGEGE